MKRSILIAESLAFALVAVGAAAALAENGSLTLGSGTGSPGRDVQLPIYLNLPKGQQFERILAIVEHPPSLAYDRVELSPEIRTDDVTIDVKESAPQAGGKMKRVEITLKGGKEKPLRIGMVGSLIFTVDKKARSQMISLPVIEVKGFSKGSRAETKLRGDSGSVTIYEPGAEPLPLVTCFFFTH